MAIDATGYLLGIGVVTARSAPSGRADAVKYKASGVWLLGGEGNWELPTFTRPLRDFNGDDVEILNACPVYWPCKYWLDRDSGEMKLSVEWEEYAEETC